MFLIYPAAILIAGCIGVAPVSSELPRVAIIMDDIGYDYANSREAIRLDKPIAYAVLPFSPYAAKFAEFAHERGKDVLVHLPMEAEKDNRLLGPGALLLDMSRREIEDAVSASLDAVPHAIGVNNHMGSRLTRESDRMTWLMQAIERRGGLFFVDSRTTPESVALETARRANLTAAARDVFLDNVRTKQHIYARLVQLAERARRNGRALGIAHPHAVTLDVLRHWDATNFGVRIVGIRDFLAEPRPGAHALPLVVTLSGTTECTDQGYPAYAAEDPYGQR